MRGEGAASNPGEERMDEQETQRGEGQGPASRPDELAVVRDLLFGPEQAQLSRLRERVENPELHARDVSRVLAKAVSLSTAEDDALARSLTPAVESALKESVRRNPTILTNSIFPIIGPAIRRASAEAIGRMVQTINQLMEHGFSWRGLRWRWEAVRTGRSYAEIVLAQTLVYRVEQVFLIQRGSGLLLHHVTRPEVAHPNGDLISGLLTAIQDFVTDSFRVGPHESMHRLEVGELSVWIEVGPHATLAAVIRGHAPEGLRSTLQQALERVHQDFGGELAAMSQSGVLPAEAGPVLSECLQGEFAARPAGASGKTLVLGLLIMAALGYRGFVAWGERERWAEYLDRLGSQEGLVVISAERAGGGYRVRGLRDPLAADPGRLLEGLGLATNRISAHWEAYHALSPGLVLRRAQRVLRPPAEVVLRYDADQGLLTAEGMATSDWIAAARARGEALPGVTSVDLSRLVDPGASELPLRIRRIEECVLYFEETTRLVPGQDETLGHLATDLSGLPAVAARRGRRVGVTVVGHTDRVGTDEYNAKLSRQRAEEARGLLEAQGVPRGWLTVTGVGSSAPLRPDLPAAEEALNRRVSFRVESEPGEGEAPNPLP